jgi:hypothetical protein
MSMSMSRLQRRISDISAFVAAMTAGGGEEALTSAADDAAVNAEEVGITRHLFDKAGHRHHARCRRPWHSGFRHLSPDRSIPVPDCVPLFRYRTGSSIGILVHFGT